MSVINYDKHIWEGWTVKDFINDIIGEIDILIELHRPRGNTVDRKLIAELTSNAQPYYKKVIPEVVDYFCKRYNAK